MVVKYNNNISYQVDVQPYLMEIFEMVSNGKKNTDIQRKYGINNSTFYRWLKEKEDFRNTIDEAREYYNESILDVSLSTVIKSIKGYTYTNKIIKNSDKNGLEVTEKRIRKEPDSKVALEYLKSINPERYDKIRYDLAQASIKYTEQKTINESKGDDIIQQLTENMLKMQEAQSETDDDEYIDFDNEEK